MDNLGDWLYVIFLVVAGISGFISSARKKRVLQEEERRSQREILVDDIDVFPEHFVPKTASVQVATIQPKKKKSPISPVVLSSEDIREPEVVPPVTAKELHDPEALRKAVIYTEIFNRKY
ncbi:MAG: hypothetical protein LBU03_00715 [Tannerellaceae bacterium]|jgi:hypothetical protein|nr:hypothetical protein [Tannerellaceae bacterium]